MKSLFLSTIAVLTYVVNAVKFKAICTPHEYGGTNGLSVNIDGTSYPMTSNNQDILYEFEFDGQPKNYYYEIAGTPTNELSLIGEPRVWDSSRTETLYEVYGRKLTVGDSILKTIPRLYEPLKGYDKYSLLFQEGILPVIHFKLNEADYTEFVGLTTKKKFNYVIEFDLYTPEEKYHYTNATIKLSGQGSQNMDKKPFKVNLSKGDPDKSNTQIFNREEFKLRNLRLDESYIKNKLTSDIAESLGLPITQSVVCRLYINNKSFGLYELSDLYKKKFIKRFFDVKKGDSDIGTLFKGISGSVPAFLYPEEEQHMNDLYEIIVPKAATPETYNTLKDLMNWLNTLPTTATKAEIEQKFDVDMFLKFAALEYLVCQWDGYLENGNNYFLYFEPNNGKAHFFSYDFDSTFGKWCSASRTNSIDDYVTFSDFNEEHANPNFRTNLLYQKLLKNQEIRAEYENLVKDIVTNLFNMEALGPRINYFYEFLKQDMYWDSDCLNASSPFHIPTKDYRGKEKEPITPEKIDEQYSDTDDNVENLKGYIKFKSNQLATLYNIPKFNAESKYGTVGNKIIKKNKKNGGDDDNESGSISNQPALLLITLLSIFACLFM